MPHSDSSAEEGELSDQEEITLPPLPQKPKRITNAGALWSDFMINQNLEEGFQQNSVADEGKLLDRGAESYVIPETAEFEDNEQDVKTNGANELFESTQLQEFGVNKSEVKASRKRKSSPESNSSRPQSSSSNRSNKFKKVKKYDNERKNKLIKNNYTPDQMFETEISLEGTIEETGKIMAQLFGELDDRSITFAVEQIGVPLAIELYNKTVEIEKNGGIQIVNGARRRTPGGVFFKCLKESDKIEKKIKNKIGEYSRKVAAELPFNRAHKQKFQKKSDQKLKPLPDAKALLTQGISESSPNPSGDATPPPTLDLKAEIANLMDFDD